jgi:hypothetical protein
MITTAEQIHELMDKLTLSLDQFTAEANL